MSRSERLSRSARRVDNDGKLEFSARLGNDTYMDVGRATAARFRHELHSAVMAYWPDAEIPPFADFEKQLLKLASDLATKATETTVVQLVSAADIAQRPATEYTIEGLIPDKSLVVRVAPPDSAKTFLALGWSLGVTSGRHWFRRRVRAGPTVYVAAEGNLRKRIKAWSEHHKVPLDGLTDAKIVERPVHLLHAEAVDSLLRAIEVWGRQPV